MNKSEIKRVTEGLVYFLDRVNEIESDRNAEEYFKFFIRKMNDYLKLQQKRKEGEE